MFRACGRQFFRRYGKSLSIQQRKVIRAIVACRTKQLGGHVSQCDNCNHRLVAYNSCRNRHCPKCQAGARAKWMAKRAQELLPVPYFHVVFTIPHELSALALQNKALVYAILFRAAAQTLSEVAQNPKHLGAKIGFLGVLHTWGQNLMHHPHVHFVVPGGGISRDGGAWVYCKRSRNRQKRFFLPVRVLSRVFRGKFIAALKKSWQHGDLKLLNALAPLQSVGTWNQFLTKATRHDWVVYAKRPFGGPEQVLKYLARYTHRVAISNQRLIALEEDRVRFHHKDYAHGNRTSTMALDGVEFLRRFLMHTLPKGFTRIRHFGFLSNNQRAHSLKLCRRLLNVEPQPDATCMEEADAQNTARESNECNSNDDRRRCPSCKAGRMQIVEMLPALYAMPRRVSKQQQLHPTERDAW